MPLNPKFNKFTTQGPAVVTFSYEDFVNGEGVSEFQAIASIDSVGTTYHLTNKPFKSKPTNTGISLNNTSTTTTYNFDSDEFLLPRTAKGKVSIGVQMSNTNGNTGTATSRLIITLKHYDGTDYTNLGTVTTQDLVVTNASATEGLDCLVSFDISAQLFAEGDSLRLEVQHFTNSEGVSNKNFIFYHNPQNTAGTVTNALTTFKINIPFLVE